MIKANERLWSGIACLIKLNKVIGGKVLVIVVITGFLFWGLVPHEATLVIPIGKLAKDMGSVAIWAFILLILRAFV